LKKISSWFGERYLLVDLRISHRQINKTIAQIGANKSRYKPPYLSDYSYTNDIMLKTKQYHINLKYLKDWSG
jgi:hypothetical protein